VTRDESFYDKTSPLAFQGEGLGVRSNLKNILNLQIVPTKHNPMDISIFTEKTIQPDHNDLKKALGDHYRNWCTIRDYVLEQYPGGIEEWNFPGIKYGWSFRIKDKKRAIIYLLPRDGYFKAAFVFGAKAFEQVMQSSVSDDIKTELAAAKPYAEGRGIRIDLRDEEMVRDIKTLVQIKLSN
jgi:hypothetical protein